MINSKFERDVFINCYNTPSGSKKRLSEISENFESTSINKKKSVIH